MADLAGRLNIELGRKDGGGEVSIRSSRPVLASRVFVGKRLEETAVALPSLFSVCATAQACACLCACEAAVGFSSHPVVASLRLLLVDAETLKEHLWRLLLDWPRFLGEPPQAEGIREVMSAFARLGACVSRSDHVLRLGAAEVDVDLSGAAACMDELERVISQRVLDRAPAAWLTDLRSESDLLEWSHHTATVGARLIRDIRGRGWSSLGPSAVSALPDLSAAELDGLLSGPEADRFVAAPLWRGAPAETSPFTRNRDRGLVAGLMVAHGNGLLPRLTARLVEVAALQVRLRDGLEDLGGPLEAVGTERGEGVGLARVQAARGLLVHRVVVDRGCIRDYRILAPTEWNFHPLGVVGRGLAGLPPADADILARQVGLFVTAVDPCVEYDVKIR